MAKPQHHFSLVFHNLPFSNEEWKRTNKWRQEAWDRLSKATQERVMEKPSYRQYYTIRKTRPVHSFRYGPTCFNETEARNHCEEALAKGAQQVVYSICGPKGVVATWIKRKGGPWYCKK